VDDVTLDGEFHRNDTAYEGWSGHQRAQEASSGSSEIHRLVVSRVRGFGWGPTRGL